MNGTLHDVLNHKSIKLIDENMSSIKTVTKSARIITSEPCALYQIYSQVDRRSALRVRQWEAKFPICV